MRARIEVIVRILLTACWAASLWIGALASSGALAADAVATTQHWVGRSDASARTRKYAWTAGDRIASIEDEGVDSLEYEYDLRGALVKTAHADGRVELRAADDVGDLFESLSGDDREYGLAGEVLKRRGPDGVTTYRYDEDGSLSEREDPDGGCWRYWWDDAGCLVQVDRPDGVAIAMQYDALGRRVSKNCGGVVTRWIWDGDLKLHEWQERGEAPELRLGAEEQARLRVLEENRERFEALYGDAAEERWLELLADDEEYPRAHAVMRRRVEVGDLAVVDETVVTWLFEPDSFAPMARVTAGGEVHSVVCDHLGTPLVVLDGGGASVMRLTVDTFGRATVEGDGRLCPFRFPGMYADDETGLYENRFRFFDPECGRYVSRDPIGLRGGIAVYGYVGDPGAAADPVGLAPVPVAGSGCDASTDQIVELTPRQVRQANSTGFYVTATPDGVVKVVRAPARYRGPAPSFDDLAKTLGFRKIRQRSHGQPIFTDGKRFISPDADSHNGGVWTMADTVRNLGRKSTRMGTYDESLNRIGD